MSHNTAFIASLKIRLGLDSFLRLQIRFDNIKVHFTSLLIELLTHKLTASF